MAFEPIEADRIDDFNPFSAFLRAPLRIFLLGKDDDGDFSPVLQKANSILQEETLDIRFVRGKDCPKFDVTSCTKQLLEFVNKDFHQGSFYTDGTYWYAHGKKVELCVRYKMREPQQMNLLTRWEQADRERLAIGGGFIISGISRVSVCNLGCEEDVLTDEFDEDILFHVFRSAYQGITRSNAQYFSNSMNGICSDVPCDKESEDHIVGFLTPSEYEKMKRVLAASYKYWVSHENKIRLEAVTTPSDTSMGSSVDPKLKSVDANGEDDKMDSQNDEMPEVMPTQENLIEQAAIAPHGPLREFELLRFEADEGEFPSCSCVLPSCNV